MSRNGRRHQWKIQFLLLIVLASTEVVCGIAETALLSGLEGRIRTSRSVHMPLYRTEARRYTKRDQHHAEIGVGDDLDM